MDHKIVWAPSAVVDLDEIVSYIARDSHVYASRVAQRILQAVERLELLPQVGRAIPEMNDPSIRDLIVYRYRIIYRLTPNQIQVVRILHGMRDVEQILERDGL